MKKTLIVVAALAQWACTQTPGDAALDAIRERAQRVTITRDNWGIPHVSGPKDADAVFGVMYAEAEDDFNRIETNIINAMGRLAEAEGEREVFRDLRMKLFVDPDVLKELYSSSPDSLKQLDRKSVV